MKKSSVIASVIFLLAVYCFSITASASSSFSSSPTTSDHKGNTSIFHAYTSCLFYHNPQTVVHLNAGSNLPVNSVKKPFNLFNLKEILNHQIFRISFREHQDRSEHYAIQFKKTDIIFPFHFFG